MKVQHFFDPDTFTLTYVVHDEKSKDALIIDPVLDFDLSSGFIQDKQVLALVDYVKKNELNVHLIMETHVHADHLSGANLLKHYFPQAKSVIGSRIKTVQETFQNFFNLSGFKTDGSQFDILANDFDELNAGTIKIKVIPTPGHTPACVSYLIGDAVFTGDALFMPDSGTGRCDFPKGSAGELYHSIHNQLYRLPDETRVFVGHDYQPDGRELRFETTIGESKKSNIQLKNETTLANYVLFREARDKTLKAPKLLLPSLQINMAAGKLPLEDFNGIIYLKLPIKTSLQEGSL